MPLFSVYAMDRRPDGPTIRAETRPAHVEYLRQLGNKVRLAGPIFANDGETVAGSLIVLEAASKDEAFDIVAKDPYSVAGLFSSCDVRLYNQVFPES
jgi:uncharacterized protein YciI